MDEISRAFFEQQLKIAFMEKKANEFQSFFSSLMEMRYPEDYVPVRPWGNVGDKKNDGYLRSERTVFQVYAPNEMRARATVAKIDEDFAKACAHWPEDLDKWVLVHNSLQGLGPEVTARLLELDREHPKTVAHWGFQEIRTRAFELSEENLASLLGHPPTLRSIINLGLADLAPVLDQISSMPAPAEPDLRPPPADKIKRNMLSEHVGTLLKAGMVRADLVRRYFRAQPTKQDEIAESFRQRYCSARGEGLPPDKIFTELQRYAGGNVVHDAARQGAVLAALAFFFEECDIFDRDGVEGGAQ